MNIKERAMTAYRREEPDRIPWLIYYKLLPVGYLSRQLRNRGLGLRVAAPVFKEEMPHVEVESKTIEDVVYIKYHTPIGSLSMKRRTGLPEGTGGSWVIEYLIKDVSDFRVAEFIIEDTVYTPDYKPFLDAEKNLGEDGIVFVWAGRSPFQKLQIEWMGQRRFAIEMYRHPEEFEGFLRLLERKANERYEIVSESPAEVINGMDNISSEIVSPKVFEKYLLPFYNRQAHLLHKKDKIYENHMDGKLKSLKDLISKTELDAIEAFTPIPMGNLTLIEARALWRDKVICLNFPESLFLEEPETIKSYALNLLKDAAPGDKFIMSITENIHPDFIWNGLSAITEILQKYGKYPIRVTE